MLTELRVVNFAIVDELNLKFGPALTIFTGETGAGKSIIIDAVETILGSRIESTMVRTGAQSATVEGTFQITGPIRKPVHAILEREELLDDPNYVVVAREIRVQGRSVARINGRSVGVALLKELGQYLVDVHGQSEHLSLLHTRQHLRLLDNYAGVEKPLATYKEQFRNLQGVRRDLEALRSAERDAARRADLLSYQINEIEAAGLNLAEDDELKAERVRLANAENLAKTAQEVLFLLDEGDPETQSGTDLVGQAALSLGQLARVDNSQENLAESLLELSATLTDLALEVRDYLEGIEFNPRRLEQVEERIDLITSLKRKYGDSIGDVLAFASTARTQLDQINNAEARTAELEQEEQDLLAKLAKSGKKLGDARKRAAKKLGKAIEGQLGDLRMDGAQFAVDFQTRPDPNGVEIEEGHRVAFGPMGLEIIQFLVAPNPGEGLKPLAKIASGGEMSRLMLALKNVLAAADHTPTLIFDEIDQGIGGRVGTTVGQKLYNLALEHQVLCITHLPQLAAHGRQHYRVQKQVARGRTSTQVESIEGDVRLKELATMLGEVSEGTLQSAREMLDAVSGLERA
jgi:DNA repair protein RecN (Recombination protein N)